MRAAGAREEDVENGKGAIELRLLKIDLHVFA